MLIIGLSTSAAASDGEAPDDAASRERPVFLVTDIVVGPNVPIDGPTARDVLSTRFGRLRDKLEVRSVSEVKSTLDAVALAQLVGSSERDDDLARVGGYVNVDRLVFGRLANVGGVVDVQVRVFNVREGVTEVALSRRLKQGAAPSLVLAVLDALADNLAAWVLRTYTDGAPSAAFVALKGRKATPAARVDATASPWSGLGIGGGAALGAGAVALAGGIAGFVRPDVVDPALAIGLTSAGAGLAAIGATLVVIDAVPE